MKPGTSAIWQDHFAARNLGSLRRRSGGKKLRNGRPGPKNPGTYTIAVPMFLHVTVSADSAAEARRKAVTRAMLREPERGQDVRLTLGIGDGKLSVENLRVVDVTPWGPFVTVNPEEGL